MGAVSSFMFMCILELYILLILISAFFFFNFQGPSSKNPLSFKWYNPEEEIHGKKMKVGFHLYSKKLPFLSIPYCPSTSTGF